MEWTFGVKITRDGDDFVATSRDLPEVLTAGATLDEARALAADAVDAVVAHRIERGESLAAPSRIEDGEDSVELPLQMATKAALYLAWRRSGLSKSEVARRMGVGENEVRRILSPRHGTRLATVELAAKALGVRVTLDLSQVA